MKQCFFILVSILFAGPVFSQRVLTLKAAIDSALKQNLDIAIARTDIEAAAITNHISVAGGVPTVTATINSQEQVTAVNQKLNSGQEINRSSAASNSTQIGVTASMLVFNGWRVIATKKRLAELEKLTEAQLAAQVQNVVAQVMISYYDVVRQGDYLSTLNYALQLAQDRLRIFQVRKEVGYANNADIFQAQIDVNTILQNIGAQQLVLSQAKVDLMDLIDSRDSSFVIMDSIIVDPSLTLEPVMAYIQQHPEVQVAVQQVKVNEQLAKEIGAQRYPAVRVNGGYNFNRNQNAAGLTLLNQSYGPFLGVNIQVPIFNGGAVKRQKRAAELDITAAALQKESVLITLNNAALRSFGVYRNTLQQLQQERENYELSRRLVELTIHRFNENVATIIEVREAQRSFEETGFRLVNLSYAAKVAEIELRRLSNQLPL